MTEDQQLRAVALEATAAYFDLLESLLREKYSGQQAEYLADSRQAVKAVCYTLDTEGVSPGHVARSLAALRSSLRKIDESCCTWKAAVDG